MNSAAPRCLRAPAKASLALRPNPCRWQEKRRQAREQGRPGPDAGRDLPKRQAGHSDPGQPGALADPERAQTGQRGTDQALPRVLGHAGDRAVQQRPDGDNQDKRRPGPQGRAGLCRPRRWPPRRRSPPSPRLRCSGRRPRCPTRHTVPRERRCGPRGRDAAGRRRPRRAAPACRWRRCPPPQLHH